MRMKKASGLSKLLNHRFSLKWNFNKKSEWSQKVKDKSEVQKQEEKAIESSWLSEWLLPTKIRETCEYTYAGRKQQKEKQTIHWRMKGREVRSTETNVHTGGSDTAVQLQVWHATIQWQCSLSQLVRRY